MTKKRRTTASKLIPLELLSKDSTCRRTLFGSYSLDLTRQQAVSKPFLDLLKISRWKRLFVSDPLSPLIYILVVDALHEGWRDNPLYSRKTGYRFSNNKTLRISSTGYADDAMIYAENWGDIWAMNQWTREFCRAHGFKISPKTKYFISDYKTRRPSMASNCRRWGKILPPRPKH
jgi:hypothetical protein